MILDIKHLSKSFGKHEVLKDIDFSVNKGDVIARSGATGFCDMPSVQIDLTVFDVPVCPYTYQETPVIFSNP